MQKFWKARAAVLAAGMMLAGGAGAQQTPAAPATPAKPATGTATTKTHTATGAQKAAPAPLVLKTPKEKASYAIGTSIGRKLHDDSLDLNTAILMRGLKDAAAGIKPVLTDDEMRTALIDFQQSVQQAVAIKNKKDGDAYRAANHDKPGVVTLPSGLQYKVLQAGTGPKPSATDSVVCNYRGTFVDGKEFDSSTKHGGPATLPVTGVIKGWTEALEMMPVGSKWQLVVPPQLGYGEQGRPGMPPNSTLVFDVELVKIADKEKPAEPAGGAGAASAPTGTPGNPTAAPGGQPATAPAGAPSAAPGSAATPPAGQPGTPATQTPPSQPQEHPQR